jgi:hypothetical protein
MDLHLEKFYAVKTFASQFVSSGQNDHYSTQLFIFSNYDSLLTAQNQDQLLEILLHQQHLYQIDSVHQYV